MAEEEVVAEKVAADQVEDIDDIKNAKLASDEEHETTLWQGLKHNKKAAFWSVVLSTTIIMEGYDVGKHDIPLELTIVLCGLRISNGIFPAALSVFLHGPSLTVS